MCLNSLDFLSSYLKLFGELVIMTLKVLIHDANCFHFQNFLSALIVFFSLPAVILKHSFRTRT